MNSVTELTQSLNLHTNKQKSHNKVKQNFPTLLFLLSDDLSCNKKIIQIQIL